MYRSFFIKAILFTTIITLIWSCKKEPDLIGLDLIPEDELLSHGIVDTITVIAITEKDTLLTRNSSTDMLGSLNDPAFGKTSASFYTQFRLPSFTYKFGKNPVPDSIFITLPYKGLYGDKNASQTVKVYEVTDTISHYVNYFQYSTLPVSSELIGEATFVPNLTDTLLIDSVETLPIMKIPLSLDFARRLMDTANKAAYTNDSTFVTTFKGLYFVTEDASGSGSVMYLNPTSEYSRIHLYYRYTTESNAQDTTKFMYLLNSSCARFNHFEHFSYTGADPSLLDQFAGNAQSASEKLFLQSMAGTRIKLEFPYLKNLAGKNLAIHEAALLFEPISDEINTAPALLNIKEMVPRSVIDTTAAGAELSPIAYRALPDEEEGATHILGNLDKGKYKFRITRYIQDRLIRPDDTAYPLSVYIASSNTLSNSSVIKGTSGGTARFKLVLYLTPMD